MTLPPLSFYFTTTIRDTTYINKEQRSSNGITSFLLQHTQNTFYLLQILLFLLFQITRNLHTYCPIDGDMPLWDKVWELWYGKKEEKKKEMTIYEVAEARVKK